MSRVLCLGYVEVSCVHSFQMSIFVFPLQMSPMLVHTGNQQTRAGIHTQIIYNTGPIQEIQQATEVLGKEDHHVVYYIVI